jgi:REP element-mobilizing transposase RayT
VSVAHKAYRLYAHLTWGTWRKQRSVRAADARVVADAILAAAGRHDIHVLAQAVLSDHVHVLVSYRPDQTLMPFLRDAKSESARRVNQNGPPRLRWRRGYYAGSLSLSHVHPCRLYIGAQFRRHPERVPA